MKRKSFNDLIPSYLAGELSAETRQAFEAALQSDEKLAQALRAYETMLKTEKLLAAGQLEPRAGFTNRIMAALEEQPDFFERLYGRFNMNRYFVGSLATVATVLVVFVLANQAARYGSVKEAALKHEARPADSGPPSAHRSGLEARSMEAPRVAGGPQIAEEESSSGFRANPQPPSGEADSLGGAKGNMVDGQALLDDGRKPVSKGGPVIAEPIAPGEVREKAVAPRQEKKKDFGGSRSDAPVVGAMREPESRAAEIHKRVLERAGNAHSARVPEGGEGFFDMIAPPFPQPHLPIVQPPGTKEYMSFTENSRVSVSEQPVSTFSADVDTASYTLVRRLLQEGRMPPADAVRVEEFINYFDYNYPVQYERPFTVSYEVAPSPLEQDRYLLKLGVKTRDARPSNAGWNLVFLVDVSGSMDQPSKLPLVKSALKILAEKMRPQDRVAIVTYAGTTGVALPSASGDKRSEILSAIDALRAGGSTYGSGGLQLAYEIAEKNRIANSVNRVVLTTDGDFNVGLVSHEELVRMVEEKRKSGISLTVIGVGNDNLKDGTLLQIADKGNGNYFYLDGIREARRIFETKLASTIETVAKDVKLQVEFNPEQVAQYRLVGYEKRHLNRQDFNNDAVDAGEIGSGHTVTAVYELVLKGSSLAGQLDDTLRYQKPIEPKVSEEKPAAHPDELAFLKIRYKAPGAEQSELLEYPIERGAVRSSVNETSADFKFAAAVAYFAQLLKGSSFAGSYSYDSIAELAQGAIGEDQAGQRREFVELVKDAKALRR